MVFANLVKFYVARLSCNSLYYFYVGLVGVLVNRSLASLVLWCCFVLQMVNMVY